MSMCTSYVPTHIYIADMRTKEVSKCPEEEEEEEGEKEEEEEEEETKGEEEEEEEAEEGGRENTVTSERSVFS